MFDLKNKQHPTLTNSDTDASIVSAWQLFCAANNIACPVCEVLHVSPTQYAQLPLPQLVQTIKALELSINQSLSMFERLQQHKLDNSAVRAYLLLLQERYGVAFTVLLKRKKES
ncbi:hypothetical protein LX64_01102 [Chitinophaga skermanii]|uniref:Uncharacterized protein n=1 Tax=Chitinophaga skermanii TaxID=331697 RepID=A0A327QVT3_9BACT|nr:hypothetical protein [Chitinophaga skermanii]RAJ08451.1 hypothetical protein LX64_01102 [Chitinophaga skermanii]